MGCSIDSDKICIPSCFPRVCKSLSNSMGVNYICPDIQDYTLTSKSPTWNIYAHQSGCNVLAFYPLYAIYANLEILCYERKPFCDSYVYRTYHLKSKNIFTWKDHWLKYFIPRHDTITLQVAVHLYLKLRMILHYKKEVFSQSVGNEGSLKLLQFFECSEVYDCYTCCFFFEISIPL